MRLAMGACSCALLALFAHSALADSVDLRNLRQPTDPEGSVFMEGTRTPGPGNWNAGLWVSYAHELLVMQDASGAEVAVPIQNQLSIDYLGSVGLGKRLALGVLVPTVVWQQGENSERLTGSDGLPSAALGDVLVDAKLNLLEPGDLAGIGLGVLGRLGLPTSTRDGYLSDDGVSGEVRGLFELMFVGSSLRATAGARVREERSLADQRLGTDLPWGAGIAFKPQVLGLDQAGHWSWNAEAHGLIALEPKFGSDLGSPVLGTLAARYSARPFSVMAGAEAPLHAGFGSPAVRAVLALGFAARFIDLDEDGIEDEADACPELAEDRDKFEDSDGCPDFDNDGDGVGDAGDKCPTELEDEDGFQDDDGCPDLDNDGDKVPDTSDRCPARPGKASTNPAFNGCPASDRDRDGLDDDVDRCPKKAEDKDGFEDDDGCPDLDNDGDKVSDELDACPMVPGEERSEPRYNGCPNPDVDGDTFDNETDKCPNEPETFNGADDADGCPEADQKAPLLVTIERTGTRARLALRGKLSFSTVPPTVELAADSEAPIRAMAQALNQDKGLVLLVGVRAEKDTPEAQQASMNRAFAVVHTLRAFTHRDGAAEVVGFSAVKDAPGARQSGLGWILLAPQPNEKAKP
jgi:OmpA-OmpF porin, OOP family